MERLNLKVTVDTQAGFCFGVTHAIEQAEKVLKSYQPLYCVGELVHNDEEILRLEKMGLVVIQADEITTKKGCKILFRAHGEPPESYHSVQQNNNELIDATCPIVKKLQSDVKKSYDNGENIYIYGKIRHPEIAGIMGYIHQHAVVFNSLEELKELSLPNELTLYYQTTQNQDNAEEIVLYLKERGIKVKVGNKVCAQVNNRRKALVQFCKKHQKIIFIAGKKSANGQSLFQICKLANQQTYFVSTVDELQDIPFHKNETVGISGATSTPLWVIDQIAQCLKKM